MTTPIEETIVESMQAEIEHLNAQLDESFHLNMTLIKRTEFLDAEIKRLRAELSQTKQDWHNQYTTAMHLSADLAEAKQYTLADVVTTMIGEKGPLLVPEGAPEQES